MQKNGIKTHFILGLGVFLSSGLFLFSFAMDTLEWPVNRSLRSPPSEKFPNSTWKLPAPKDQKNSPSQRNPALKKSRRKGPPKGTPLVIEEESSEEEDEVYVNPFFQQRNLLPRNSKEACVTTIKNTDGRQLELPLFRV